MIRLYTFLIFVAIGTVLLYVFFIMPQSDFVGKTSLLIIPKTMVIASNADNVVNDITFIANEAVKYNVDVQSYGASVDISRLKAHDIVQIVVQSESKNDIVFIEKSVLKSIVGGIEKYYAINTDFSVKIVQIQTVQENMIVQIASYILMIAVAVGLIAGVLALSYMTSLVRQQNEYEDNINGEKIFAGYYADKNISESEKIDYKIEEIDNDSHATTQSVDKKAESISEKENIQNEQYEAEDVVITELQTSDISVASISAPDGLSTTPGNLPIVDTSDFGFGRDTDTIKMTDDEKDSSMSDGEPTEEELKARLNELLNGKL